MTRPDLPQPPEDTRSPARRLLDEGADPARLLDSLRKARSRRRALRSANPLTHPAQFVVTGFVLAVGFGTVLLMLPMASAAPGHASFTTALFTATSAVCVTGLVVVDTAGFWSGFGESVVLVLVQVGGLGIMTFASLLGLLVAGRLGLRSRLLAQAETRTLDLGTVRRVLSGIVRISLGIEAVVWVALTLRLWAGYHEPFGRAVYDGLFHAVSAYNNAGFALWPDSLVGFASDPWILLPIAVALVMGGVGYPVLLELLQVRRVSRWSVHTRLTLVATGVLLLVGPLLVYLTERNNPATLGGLSGPGQLLSAFFSGVSPRTAGFNSIDYGQADPATLLVTDALMLVGGGSAGTAGGIKVTTVTVLTLAVISEIRGETDVNAFGRRVAASTLRQALAVAMLALAVVTVSTFVMLELTRLDLDAVLFETVSAFATVGLSTGITPALPPAAQYLLIGLMLLGRIGPITAASALALREKQRLYRHPETRPIVG
jgi:potassium uptake TrkH family protein